MPLATLSRHSTPLSAASLKSGRRTVLFILPKNSRLPADTPGRETLTAVLARRGMQPEELARKPLAAELPQGVLAGWVMLDAARTTFQQLTTLRTALRPLLEGGATALALSCHGSERQRAEAARLAAYVAWVNGAPLPRRKSKDGPKALERIALHGIPPGVDLRATSAAAEGNLLCRSLTALPPNELTPGAYRRHIKQLAQRYGWTVREYGFDKLRRMGAGAFAAVAQGSPAQDAAIVRISRKTQAARRTVAAVGKGICFDTGGHNLKPARSMHGMHEDMNGSAVALGLLTAATLADLPVNVDCWLALAENHISPRAYRQNDVIRALDGTTIEIVHTDAEGRLVLADTLTLAARGKPDAIVDFATLTGTMEVALGTRASGVFCNDLGLLQAALAAARDSGERIWPFPMDEDYAEALESQVADVKQCIMEGEADHILAALFLKRFVAGIPWLHMDLSASRVKGGLGAVGTDLTGFGVAWGFELLKGIADGAAILTRNGPAE